MFNAARGSLLVAALFHFQMNGPAWPDAQPWDMYLFVAVAAIVVVVNRKRMLARDGAATGVLLPGVEETGEGETGEGETGEGETGEGETGEGETGDHESRPGGGRGDHAVPTA
jgi:uncharacterized low-complexity protein